MQLWDLEVLETEDDENNEKIIIDHVANDIAVPAIRLWFKAVPESMMFRRALIHNSI